MRRYRATMLAACLCLCLGGLLAACGGRAADGPQTATDDAAAEAADGAAGMQQATDGQDVDAVEQADLEEDVSGQQDDAGDATEHPRLKMRAEKGSPSLDVVRPAPGARVPQDLEKDSWTVLVYMGEHGADALSDTEQRDLANALAEQVGKGVWLVVDAGPHGDGNADEVRDVHRVVVHDGKVSDAVSAEDAPVEDVPAEDARAAAGSDLADFISWGVRTYPAEHLGLVVWDSSLEGEGPLASRFDEALSVAFEAMWSKFDFVATARPVTTDLSVANVLASYAEYLLVPGEGEAEAAAGYARLVQYLSEHPDTVSGGMAALSTEASPSEDESAEQEAVPWPDAGFQIVDLSRMDELLAAFNALSQEMLLAGEDEEVAAEAAAALAHEGEDGKAQAATSAGTVDVATLARAWEGHAPSAGQVSKILDAMTAAIGDGSDPDSGAEQDDPDSEAEQADSAVGVLGVYYPAQAPAAQDLDDFAQACPVPYYLAYVDRLMQLRGASDGERDRAYDATRWFEDGMWEWPAPSDAAYWESLAS